MVHSQELTQGLLEFRKTSIRVVYDCLVLSESHTSGGGLSLLRIVSSVLFSTGEEVTNT